MGLREDFYCEECGNKDKEVIMELIDIYEGVKSHQCPLCDGIVKTPMTDEEIYEKGRAEFIDTQAESDIEKERGI